MNISRVNERLFEVRMRIILLQREMNMFMNHKLINMLINLSKQVRVEFRYQFRYPFNKATVFPRINAQGVY